MSRRVHRDQIARLLKLSQYECEIVASMRGRADETRLNFVKQPRAAGSTRRGKVDETKGKRGSGIVERGR